MHSPRLGGCSRRERRLVVTERDTPEICICAALKLEDGRVIHGHRHNDCILTAIRWKQAGQDVGLVSRAVQGFVTSQNRFVDREEGAALMRAVQHQSEWTGKPFNGDTLFSEDLY